jgi:hypothetical protein
MSIFKDIAGSLGVLPQLAAKGGKNAGFALGILPGMMYRNQYDEEEPAAAAAQQQAAGMKKGGKVSSASARGDGIAQRGKTKGTMIMCGGGYAKGKK